MFTFSITSSLPSTKRASRSDTVIETSPETSEISDSASYSMEVTAPERFDSNAWIAFQ